MEMLSGGNIEKSTLRNDQIRPAKQFQIANHPPFP